MGFGAGLAAGQKYPTDAGSVGFGRRMVGGEKVTVGDHQVGFEVLMADGQIMFKETHAATPAPSPSSEGKSFKHDTPAERNVATVSLCRSIVASIPSANLTSQAIRSS